MSGYDDEWADLKRAWDAAEVTKTFQLPDGRYVGEIVSAAFKRNGNGTSFLRLGFASDDVQLKGGRATRDCWVNSPENIARTKEKLRTLGVTDFDAIKDGGLVGVKVRFGVQTKTDQRGSGSDHSTVSFFEPVTPAAEPSPPREEDWGSDNKIPF